MNPDRRSIFDIKLGIQILSLILGLVSIAIYTDRRITTVEVKLNEQMKGYQIVFTEVNRRLNSFERKIEKFEDKLDRVILRP